MHDSMYDAERGCARHEQAGEACYADVDVVLQVPCEADKLTWANVC